MNQPANDTQIPPHDFAAEAAVLATIIISGSGAELDEVGGTLRAEHFYSGNHRWIYTACVELHRVGKPTDIVSVGAWLKDNHRITQVGGMAYLTEILNATPSISRIVPYAGIVVGKARMREFIQISQRLAVEAYGHAGETQEFLDRAYERFEAIGSTTKGGEFERIGTVAHRVMAEMSEAARTGNTRRGVSCGFPEIDKRIHGLREGTLTVIGARPGKGKTALAMNIAWSVATAGLHVPFFTLEMTNADLAARAMSAAARVDQGRFFGEPCTQDEWRRLIELANRVRDIPLYLRDDRTMTMRQMRSELRRLRVDVERRNEKIGLVVVDYLQLMGGDDAKRGENREREVSQISRSLQKLAGELKCPIIALSQLNRDVEKRTGDSPRPRISDLRESGQIEGDAHNILLIHREEKKTTGLRPGQSRFEPKAEIIIAKARNGREGIVPVKFDGRFTLFEELIGEDGRDDHD